MGFFSRLFQPRADGAQPSDDWTSLPDSQASQLVLFDDQAQKLVAQFDIDAAIVTHQRWLPWLGQVLMGQPDARLRPEVVIDERSSELGEWLHTSGRVALGHFPAFDMLLRRHRFFHQQAAAMLTHAQAGETQPAHQAYKSCQHASRQVVLLLRELQRGLLGSQPSQTRRAPTQTVHDAQLIV